MSNNITLNLNIIEARDLLAHDSNGFSDPYVLITDQPGLYNIPKKGLKTHTLKKTLNPVWNQTFTIVCNPKKIPDIKFQVYDYNFITKDVVIGEGSINLEWLCGTKIKFHEEWIKLSLMKKDKKTKEYNKITKGEIHISITLPPEELTKPNQSIRTDYPLNPGNWIPILEPIVNVGLGWDFTGGETFDLDASVTGFDSNFNPIESIYYGHLTGLNRSVLHHGDNLTGEGEGDDEVITIGLDRVPNNITSLAVTVNSYKGNSIIKAKSGFIRLYTNSTGIGKYILSRSKDCIGLLLGLFERDISKLDRWFFRVMVDPIEGNQVTKSYSSMKELLIAYNKNFIDEAVNKYIPLHPLPYEMLFKTDIWIPIDMQKTYIGLGWDFQKGEVYDLDASLIVFDMNNQIMEIIYHKNIKSKDGNIYHYGDNKTGRGDGDDEMICVDFPHLNNNISSMAVVVNSFKGNNLTGIRGGFIRLFYDTRPIGCYLLNEGRECTGLLLGLFRKDLNSGFWFFQVMIENINGIDANESVPDVINLLNNYMLKMSMMSSNNNNNYNDVQNNMNNNNNLNTLNTLNNPNTLNNSNTLNNNVSIMNPNNLNNSNTLNNNISMMNPNNLNNSNTLNNNINNNISIMNPNNLNYSNTLNNNNINNNINMMNPNNNQINYNRTLNPIPNNNNNNMINNLNPSNTINVTNNNLINQMNNVDLNTDLPTQNEI